MKNQLIMICVAWLWSASSFAIPITTSMGSVTILGTDYYIDVIYDSLGNRDDESYDALNPVQTFTTEAEGEAAVIALKLAFPTANWSPLFGSGARVIYDVTATDYSYFTILSDNSTHGPFSISKSAGHGFSIVQFHVVNVPEPTSIALLGLGLAGLSFSRRKKSA